MRRCVGLLWLALAGPALAATEYTPPRPKPLTVDPARVIVQYKPQAAMFEQRLSAGTARNLAAEVQTLQQRAAQLGGRAGVALSSATGLGPRSHVVVAHGLTSAALAARLAQDSEVEFAVPDERMRPTRVPNDPLFASGGGAGPTVGQWYLKTPGSTAPAAINAQGAWDLTTGDTNVIVAVLDTGVRYDHPDLAGKLLPGYDMITNATVANDGDGRDADASDPGDWISSTDTTQSTFSDCDVSDSSWHGTMVSGLIAAATDNATGMAGTGWNVRVLPVRVLGKCFGFSSDIIAGMRWAAGIDVPGVPTNSTPAKVLNLSLGSSNTCSTAYQSAVSEITALGKIVVAAAGNSAGHAVGQPANCQGVIGVAGLRHIGTKVGFSDLGSQIAIAAPGGNCVNATGACLFPILTTTNSGTTTPVAANAAYTDASNVSVGTSFSSPLVTGTVALMASVRSSLTAAEARSLLQASARAFPFRGADSSVNSCVTPAGTDQNECYCTSSLCGAGMLDAHGAVAGAIGLVPVIGVSASPTAGQSVTLSSSSTQLPAGRSVVSTNWSLVDDGGVVSGFSSATNAAAATVTPSAAGRFTVRLTVTDSAGLTSSSETTVTVAAAPAPSSDGGGGGGAMSLLALFSLAAATWLIRRNRRPS